ncbi:MAG: carbohydrate ABC transporter permease [Ilumatobacteraceae bacterium]
MSNDTVTSRAPGRSRPLRVLTYVFLTTMALLWLVPIAGAVYSSFRPYADTKRDGIFSWPNSLSFSNYSEAFKQGGMGGWGGTFANTAFIVLPSIVLILLLSSFMAFAVSRFSWRFNVPLLLLFTAGNLLPPQVIFKPLFAMFEHTPWPDLLSDTDTGKLLGTKVAVIIIHVAFQTGFCTFVLSNYMKTIPKELNEAASVDGAGVLRQFFQIILPLCRPALAALATLEFTWLYNDFFWAVVLINQGSERPITSSIANLGGQFFSNDNLIAAASTMIALPTLAVYLALQKQFISGLTLGASKG